MKDNHMLKISIVTPYGAEERLDNFAEFLLAQGLSRQHYNVRFYTYKLRNNPQYRENKNYKGIKVFRCRQRFGLAPGLFFSLLRFRSDVVIGFHPKSQLSFSAYLAAKLTRAKFIYEIVGILHDPFIVGDSDRPLETLKEKVVLFTAWRNLFRVFFSRQVRSNWQNFICHLPPAKADAVVAISKDEKKYIKRFYGREAVVIPWAVPSAVPTDQKKPAGPVPEKFILFIAQIKKRKGWDTVFEALAVLRQQQIIKNLVFVTPHEDISEAENYAERLGIRDQVSFFKKVANEEKDWFYGQAEAVLAPSRYEGFGLPVLESWRAGKPFLGTDIPVYLEFLQHRVNSLVSLTGDGSDLAKNIKALAEEPGLAQTIIEGGYQTLAKYNDRIMVNKFIDLINSFLPPVSQGTQRH